MRESTRPVYLMAYAAAVGLAIWAAWPGLYAGYAIDDYFHLAMLRGWFPVERSWLDLYDFANAARGELPALRDAGVMPWWVHPELRLAGLRPLASALLTFDHRVLGDAPLAHHVHSLGWWVAMIATYTLFARRLLAPATACVASVAFILDPAHVVPIAWLANRSVLVSVTFGLVALLGHVRWREDGRAWGAFVSAGGFTLSLLAGEYAFAILAYVGAYEWLGRSDPARVRLRALCVPGVPTVAYVAAHVALGYGAEGSSGYLDPLESPGDFLLHSSIRFPSLLTNELLTIPSELTHIALVFDHWAAVAVLVPGLVGFAALVPGAFRRLEPEQRRFAKVLLAGTVLSILPLLPALPSIRLLVAPSVGGSAVVAVLVTDAVRRARDRTTRRGVRVWLRAGAVAILAVGHFAFAPVASRIVVQSFANSQHAVHGYFNDAKVELDRLEQLDVVLVNCPDATTLIMPPYVWQSSGYRAPASWRVLTMTEHPMKVHRIDDRTIELEVEHETNGMLESPGALFFRSLHRPLVKGERITAAAMEITVLETGYWGPTRVRYRFPYSLDAPSMRFLVFTSMGMLQGKIPAVGKTGRLPGATDLFGGVRMR